MNEEYIDFGVAPYALPKVCEVLYRNGVTDAFITQEDDDLHIRWKWRVDRYTNNNVIYPDGVNTKILDKVSNDVIIEHNLI